MEENKLAALIRPLEDFAAKHPGAYKMRVALLAAVGYRAGWDGVGTGTGAGII